MRFPAILTAAALMLAATAFGAIDLNRFPDADSVIVDEREEVEYHADGTSSSTDESWTKILTEKGRRDESVLTLDYSRRYGSAAIVYVGAIDEAGKEREIDIGATLKDSTDNGSLGSNIYDPLDRRIVCTVPGLKTGETLHVKTRRVVEKPRCRDLWADATMMEWSRPIVKASWTIHAPASRPLKRIAIRHPLGNVVRRDERLADGSMRHVFTCTNSPQAFPEPDMPPLYTQLQIVRVSTAGDWREISRWYWELSRPHLVKTNAAMVAKVKEIVAAAGAGEEARLRSLFKFVSQEVRYMGLTMEDVSPGYAPHDVDVTFNQRYGVCRDKAALLVAMLRLAGFEAYPVLINVGAKLDAEVPQPFFNHAIVSVRRNGKYELMDPTNENAKDIFPAYLGNMSYLVAHPQGETLQTSPVQSPEENRLSVVARGKLANDGSMFLDYSITMNGINDTAYRHVLVKRTDEERVQFCEKIARTLQPGAELVSCKIEPKDMRDTEKPIAMHLAVNFPEMLLRGETTDELAVPWLSRSLGMANFLLNGNTSLEKRRFSLVLDSTAKVEESLEIELGETVGAVKTLPKSLRTDGAYDYERHFAVTNGSLVARRSLTLGSVEYSPSEYLELREEIKRVEAAERQRPVFARDRLADADVRIWSGITETSIVSDDEWVTTNSSVKEVLTYAGKKGSAELKFSYNPRWRSVEVLSATVSNRDGRVTSVTPAEMNEMDCDWAAAAPRYPAAKTLVVSLPSVEIGSVISVSTVTRTKGAPAGFYGEFLFDTTEPVDYRLVRVNDFRRELVSPKRLPDEPMQPPASFWRDLVVISSNSFRRAAERLAPAVEIPEVDKVPVELDGLAPVERLRAIRDWMAKYVRVSGPGLYDLPIACQLTDPDVVLRERYATRLDYVRTLAALVRAAGLDCQIVFAANNANDTPEERESIRSVYPNVRAFSRALCRVTLSEGGFLGLGATATDYYLGVENEYAELGTSAFDGCDYFDPAGATFGVVTVPRAELKDFTDSVNRYTVRGNGSVDVDMEVATYGVGVGSIRRKFAEILPEERMRLHQSMLGEIAQAATATSDLEVDVKGYPLKSRMSAFVPDLATVGDGMIAIELPKLVAEIPSFTSKVRLTPLMVGAADPERQEIVVRFPEGYTEAEHLPESFVFTDPKDSACVWLVAKVTSEVRDGALEVKIFREIHPRIDSYYAPHFMGQLKEFYRRANSRANCTVSARRPSRSEDR